MKAKHWKMETRRQKVHKAIFMFLKKVMSTDKAYRIASAITNWA